MSNSIDVLDFDDPRGMFIIWSHESERIRKLTEIVEIGLMQNREEYLQELKIIESRINNRDELQEFRNFESDQYWQVLEDYPRFARYSMILLAYSSFEHFLAILVRDISPNPPSKTYFGDSHNHLTADLGIDLSRVASEYKFLDGSRVIRNCIAHENGKTHNSLSIFQREKAIIDSLPNDLQIEPMYHIDPNNLPRPDFDILNIPRKIIVKTNFAARILDNADRYIEEITKKVSSHHAP